VRYNICATTRALRLQDKIAFIFHLLNTAKFPINATVGVGSINVTQLIGTW